MIVNDLRTPDYLRGYKILNAEVDALKKRKQDEPFVQGLRELQEEQQYYKSFLAKPVYGSSLRVDQEAEMPMRPYKPKRILIIMGGFFAGLFLGVFFVLMKHMLTPEGKKIPSGT